MDRRTCVPIRLLDLPLFLDKYSLSESFPLTPAAVAGRATEGAGERAKVIDRESTPELAVSRRSSPLPFCSLITLDAPSLSPLPPEATEPPLPRNRNQPFTSTTLFHFTQKHLQHRNRNHDSNQTSNELTPSTAARLQCTCTHGL